MTKRLDISSIKDPINLILMQRAQPPPIVILVHLKGPLTLDKAIYRANIVDNVEIGNKRSHLEIVNEKEGA